MTWAIAIRSPLETKCVLTRLDFDSETDARARFEALRGHAKGHGGAATLEKDWRRVDSFSHLAAND